MTDSNNSSDSDSDSRTEREQLEDELCDGVVEACNKVLDDGMSYSHMATTLYRIGFALLQVSIRDQAIKQCEQAVGGKIDVSPSDGVHVAFPRDDDE